jgi:hypothetical protein
MEKSKTVEDLTYGTDPRGDYAYFIDIRHLEDGWTVDEEARTHKSEAIFFRLISSGEIKHQHGWIEDNKVVQWG